MSWVVFFIPSLSLFSQSAPDTALPGEQVTITYNQDSETALRADLFLPQHVPPPGGWPIVLYIHGGGWLAGLGFNPLKDSQRNQRYSPLKQAGLTGIPVLLAHGDRDPVLHFRHSQALHDLLNDAHTGSCTLIRVRNGIHGFIAQPGQGEIAPDFSTIQKRTAEFIAQIRFMSYPEESLPSGAYHD